MLEKINQTATAYIKKIVLRDLPINPDVSIEAQLQAIQHTVAASYLSDAMGQNICHNCISELQNMALELRKQIEEALLPCLTSRICVVIGLFQGKDPVIYNTLSQKLWTGTIWISYKMDLGGKLLLSFNSPYLKEIISGKKYEDEEEYHVNKADIQKWKAAYAEHGIKGLTTKNGTYTGDFKVAVVEYMHNTGTSMRQTAALFNIPTLKSVSDWERIYYKEGKEALYEERRGRASKMGI